MKHVAFPVPDLHQPGLGYLGRTFSQPLVALDPTHALADAATLAIGAARLSRPHPGIEYTQRLAVGAHRVGRVQVHAALGFVAQRAQALDGLAIEIQRRRVVQAQHHGQSGHALYRTTPMRLDDLAPVTPRVVEHAVGRRRVAPAATRARNARRGLGRQLLRQLHQPLVEPLVAQLHRRKLLRSPAHRSIPSSNHGLAEDR